MAEENTGSGASPTNVSDDQQYNVFDETPYEGDAGETSVYKPEEGKYGPKPYGDFTPPEYANGDPTGQKRGAFQEPQYDEQGQQVSVDPLQEVAPYMDDAELAFVNSLNPTQQGYYVNSLARIKNVYETQAQEVQAYEAQLEEAAAEIEPLKDMHDAISEKVAATEMFDSVGEYLECLIQADMEAAENPHEWILNMMRQYGISMTDLMDAGEVFIEKVNDPYYLQSQKLQRERDQYEQYVMTSEAQRAEEEQAAAVEHYADQINAFADAYDEYGYLHPYYDMVEGKMGELMSQTGSLDLEALYEQACWLVPEVRNDIIANGGGYSDDAYYQQYQQPSSYQRFATNNSGGDSTYNPPDSEDNFREIFERNYQRFGVGNSY
jgi:hypothetical protein